MSQPIVLTLDRADVELIVRALKERRDLPGRFLSRDLEDALKRQRDHERLRAYLDSWTREAGLALVPWQLEALTRAIGPRAELIEEVLGK